MAGIVVYKPTRDLYNGVVQATGGVGSGIAAQKTGYHDSRENNPSWNYSVILPLDKQGPADGAAAIDITLSDAQMKKFTKMLMEGLDKKDPRLKAIKEVIGTIDGRNVVRYTRNSPTSSPVWASSDSSHLWHIHISLFRAYINDWDVLKGIIAFLRGESSSLEGGIMLPQKGDKNTSVGYWQRILNNLGYPLTIDNDYGNATQAAVSKWFKDYSGSTYDGSAITSWIALELQNEYFLRRHQAVKNLPKAGDAGTEVGFFQRQLVAKGAKNLTINNKYDAAMVASVAAWFKAKYNVDFDGKSITSWIARELTKP